LVIVVALGLVGSLIGSGNATPRLAGDRRPNIVVIQFDDAVLSDLYRTLHTASGNAPVLPNISKLLIQRGVTFRNYYVSVPLCCPSRTALLTGRYARNNGVLGNGGRHGGFRAFRHHDYRDNVAVWLQRAGYWTAHVGKFLNGYDSRYARIPPGWSDWQTLANDPSTAVYYGYFFNSNGRISKRYGSLSYCKKFAQNCPFQPEAPGNYVTDVLSRKALNATRIAPRNKPLYLQLDVTAPHVDELSPSGPDPPQRYLHLLDGARAPRVPGFNEPNLSDKPSFLRHQPLLDSQQIHKIDHRYQARLESERAVDDGVGRLLSLLQRQGRLSNTYIFLTSDNGFFQGEHRFAQSKFLPYEPSSRMPLVVRGPGVPRLRSSRALTANIDLAPTFLRIAHARPSRSVDGRSLLGYARHPDRQSRRPILLEGFTRGKPVQPGRSAGSAPFASYKAIRIGPYKYIRYGDGQTELYNLTHDPYELNSLAWDPRYTDVAAWVAAHLRRLIRCGGASCRRPIGPVPKPRASDPPLATP
jgi:N-acetylglucosamine-6-sulfatase